MLMEVKQVLKGATHGAEVKLCRETFATCIEASDRAVQIGYPVNYVLVGNFSALLAAYPSFPRLQSPASRIS